MPAYDGYADVADYVERRCKERGFTQVGLARQIKVKSGSTYIYRIIRGLFTPSPAVAARIAEAFGDSPETIRVLMGLQTPPADGGAVALARKILRLPKREREVLEKIVEKLGEK